ncbi:CPBP family intramembrane glutamic endopeptidase [Nannocystis radixulma]|uniref:Type II CAAX endopeptidase family protein n=1 Tax=Nannocystis radixulma TaxID=2995305 RepID=A0ABT5BL43_9BACT|nr:type II CAAX endopeptidase family protein [Nannocystis radixulma]MDC0674403.1 type II CAAX endopeptidase family protein [Nannocystis radixulma]
MTPTSADLSTSNRLLGWFLWLTVAFSAVCYAALASAGTLDAAGGLWTFALMWSPGLAALLARAIVQHNLRGMGWRVPGKLLLFAWALPIAAALVVYGVAWLSGWGAFDPARLHARSQPAGLAVVVVTGQLLNFVAATGEELGWRGLLLPELVRRFSPARASLLCGVIWALYHYPALFFTDYTAVNTAPRIYVVAVFSLTVVAVSFVLTWLRLRSGSFWPAAMFHASHNFHVQFVFDGLTIPGPTTTYWTTESGAGPLLAYTGIAVWLWRRAPPTA